MNIQEPGQAQTKHLLDSIRTTWASVGNALNDVELTSFFREAKLPGEAGFAFLSFSCGHVTLTVPRQNPDDWYATKGWITPGKERIAKEVAQKYGYQLYEPFDDSLVLYPEAATSVIHHHLALSDQRQTVIVAHPLFLKICLVGKSPCHTYERKGQFPLPLGPDLLKDLSTLYEGEAKSLGAEGTVAEPAFQK